jgi:hypothetical protein
MAPTETTTDDAMLSPSGLVLQAIAAKTGREPIEIPTPLFDVVDPDALDAVLGRPESGHEIYVGFTIEGYAVQVHGDRTVYVDGQRYDPSTDTFKPA